MNNIANQIFIAPLPLVWLINISTLITNSFWMVHSRKMNRALQRVISAAAFKGGQVTPQIIIPVLSFAPQDGLGHFQKRRAISREHEHTLALSYADTDYLIDNSDPSLSEC